MKLLGFIFALAFTWALENTATRQDSPPVPRSDIIKELNFDPQSKVFSKAKGSDNWPLTWADDGHLYTAYGDGWGFEPKADRKLSLGIAKVNGMPTDIHGVNIRTDSGEQFGDGSKGKKASGMLMVDNILYMWVRNANNRGKQSQLAWSEDHGKTWEWSSWKFKDFGYCTFINFGKNYQGARDDYVYSVSHDNPDAYERADRFILMRVPKHQTKYREAYDFFVKLDSNNKPVWTPHISQRGSVFNDSRRCHRSGISYNAKLKRYFWWQAKFPKGTDGRFVGMFGVFDAPEPWGPWTTVYYTESWDIGAGETGSFPTKWMSEDGKTMYLVFSGADAFSLRKATLTLSVPAETSGKGKFE